MDHPIQGSSTLPLIEAFLLAYNIETWVTTHAEIKASGGSGPFRLKDLSIDEIVGA